MPTQTNVSQDIDTGKNALRFFHNQALRYPDNYKSTIDGLYAEISRQNKFLFEGLGLAINSTEMSDSKVKRSMEALADAGKGRLPAKPVDFINSLTKEATSVKFLDALGATAKGTVVDVAKGFQKVGDSVITTLSWGTKLLPFVVIGGGLLIVFHKAGGRALFK